MKQLGIPMSIYEPRGNPLVRAVDNLCAGGHCNVFGYLCYIRTLDEDISLERACFIILCPCRDGATFQNVRGHGEVSIRWQEATCDDALAVLADENVLALIWSRLAA